MKCSDCKEEIIGMDWQLEDGRTVCHDCCITDLGDFVDFVLATKYSENN